MRIKKISFSNFRNLSQETLDLSYNNSDNQEIYKNIFISGKNGQGQTNVKYDPSTGNYDVEQ